MSGKKGMKKYPVGIREEIVSRIPLNMADTFHSALLLKLLFHVGIPHPQKPHNHAIRSIFAANVLPIKTEIPPSKKSGISIFQRFLTCPSPSG